MPQPRPKRDAKAIEQLINAASDDGADLGPRVPVSKGVGKNKRPDYQKLLVYIPVDLHRALKREAFDSDGEVDMSDIIAELLAERYQVDLERLIAK